MFGDGHYQRSVCIKHPERLLIRTSKGCGPWRDSSARILSTGRQEAFRRLGLVQIIVHLCLLGSTCEWFP